MKKNVRSSTEISNELTILLDWQTEFFKTLSHTPAELSEYRQSCDRVRELFAELEQTGQSKAA
jgi:hypothetical protein